MMITRLLFAFASWTGFLTQAFVPTTTRTMILPSSLQNVDKFFDANDKILRIYGSLLYQSKNPYMTIHERWDDRR